MLIPEGPTPRDCDFEPRARIYLELADELASDEEPTVQLLGGVFKDIAGNNNVTQSIKALDNIAPGVSITITSSSGTTNRAATDDDGSFTVRVTSDEDLGRFPRLFFATIKAEELTSKGVATGAGTDTDLAGRRRDRRRRHLAHREGDEHLGEDDQGGR